MKKIKTTRQGQRGKSKSKRLMSFHTTFLANFRGERRRSCWRPLKVVLHDIVTRHFRGVRRRSSWTRAKSFHTTFTKGQRCVARHLEPKSIYTRASAKQMISFPLFYFRLGLSLFSARRSSCRTEKPFFQLQIRFQFHCAEFNYNSNFSIVLV